MFIFSKTTDQLPYVLIRYLSGTHPKVDQLRKNPWRFMNIMKMKVFFWRTLPRTVSNLTIGSNPSDAIEKDLFAKVYEFRVVWWWGAMNWARRYPAFSLILFSTLDLVWENGLVQADFVLPLGVKYSQNVVLPLLINDEHTRYTLTGLDLLLDIFHKNKLTQRYTNNFSLFDSFFTMSISSMTILAR